MTRKKDFWYEVLQRGRDAAQRIEKGAQSAWQSAQSFAESYLDCEYEPQDDRASGADLLAPRTRDGEAPGARRKRKPQERPPEPREDERRALESALLAPTGALATAAQMLRAQKQGNTATAGIMARQLRQQMETLEACFPGLPELADGTRYGRMVVALRTLAREDSAQSGFAALTQREIAAGLAALPERVRKSLLSINAFSALRAALPGQDEENR